MKSTSKFHKTYFNRVKTLYTITPLMISTFTYLEHCGYLAINLLSVR